MTIFCMSLRNHTDFFICRPSPGPYIQIFLGSPKTFGVRSAKARNALDMLLLPTWPKLTSALVWPSPLHKRQSCPPGPSCCGRRAKPRKLYISDLTWQKHQDVTMGKKRKRKANRWYRSAMLRMVIAGLLRRMFEMPDGMTQTGFSTRPNETC